MFNCLEDYFCIKKTNKLAFMNFQNYERGLCSQLSMFLKVSGRVDSKDYAIL